MVSPTLNADTQIELQSELLVEELVLVCASIIAKHISTKNIGTLLQEAFNLKVTPLVNSLQHYACLNLETLLQTRGLDLSKDALLSLAAFVQQEQCKKLPVTRTGNQVSLALEKWKDWLALQDLPKPYWARPRRRASPPAKATEQKSSPELKRSASIGEETLPSTPLPAPAIRSTALSPSKAVASHVLPSPSTSPTVGAWKARSAPKSIEKYVQPYFGYAYEYLTSIV